MRRGQIRSRHNFLTRKRTNNKLSALLRGARDRIRDTAALTRVINAHAWTLRLRRLVIRGHEAVAHLRRSGSRATADGQQ